jgi:tetratricopeptide (TPR) repeat protein
MMMAQVILKPLNRLFDKLEKAPITMGTGILSLLSIVLLRNFFESGLEGNQILGFTSSPAHSSLMFFDHFFLFYGSLFLWFLLLIRLVTKETMGKVANVILFSFFVLFIPPFFDFFITKGRGYDLGYLAGIDEAKLALQVFNPSQEITRVSPGQRIEIFLGCIFGLFYVYFKTRRKGIGRGKIPSIFKGILASVGIYLIILLHGLPQAFAQIPSFFTENNPASAMVAGGLVEMDTQNYGLFNLFLGGIAGLLLLGSQRQKKLNLHWTPPMIFHMSGTLIGILWGILAFRRIYPFIFQNPFNYLVFLALLLGFGLAAQIFLKADHQTPATHHDILFLGIAFLLAINVGITASILLFVFVLINWIGYRKKTILLRIFSNMLSFVIAILAGFSLFGQRETFRLVLPNARVEREAWAHFLSGKEYYLRGDYHQTSLEYERTRKQSMSRNTNYLLLLRMGDIRYRLGDLDGAIENLKKAVQIYPNRFKSYPLLGIAYIRQEKEEKALNHYRQAIHRRIEPYIFFLESGRVLSRLRRREEALLELEQALLTRAPRASCYQVWGDIEAMGRDFDSAIKMYNRAIEYDPGFGLAYSGKGTVYFEKGEYSLAEREYLHALKFSPNDETIHNNVGAVYLQQNKLEMAEISFRKAIQLAPVLAEGYFNLGMTYERRGLIEEAREFYNKTLEINPKFEQALLALREIEN